MEVYEPTDFVQFDVWDLTIFEVRVKSDNGSEYNSLFNVTSPNPEIGSVLRVQLDGLVMPGE